MAGVTFSSVSKNYGSTPVIRCLDLEARDREFLVLVGPSGCGKSTALRMIAGLESVTSGTISIGGRIVNDVPPKDRDVAMVFQNYALYPHMTVRENLEFGLKIRGTPRAEMLALVSEVARMLEIEALLDRRPRELSGGQRQRVAVGRAIVRKPAVFLFDEPLSNLDAKLRVQMRAEIARIQQRLDTTTVYVTHDQIEAMTMGHRVAVLKDGKLQQIGTPLELYERPSNVFVASFLGTPPMSLFEARAAEGGAVLDAGGWSLPVPASLRERTAAAGERVTVGVRAEDLRQPGTPTRGETAEIRGEVEIAEPLGHEVIVHVRAGRAVLVAKFDAQTVPRPGEPVTLQASLDRMHLFDSATGLRLGA
jgi:multiple sugar transport system ATP-binding protein